MKRILITGSTGFVGKHIVQSFKDDYELFGIGRSKDMQLDDEHYFKCSIDDHARLTTIFEKVRPEVLIHLAGVVHKNSHDTSEDNYMKVNDLSSRYLFDLCHQFNVEKIIYASTVEVYGEIEESIVTEETECLPVSYYGKSKYLSEQYLINECPVKQTAALRFAPVYGKGFTLNIDKRIYLKKDKVAYYLKKGDYQFNFCSIDNILDFTKILLEKEYGKEIYLVSDTKSFSAKELIKLEKQAIKISVIKLPYPLVITGITGIELISKVLGKKDRYLSKRNFDKLFASTTYSNQKACDFGCAMNHDFESTLHSGKHR